MKTRSDFNKLSLLLKPKAFACSILERP